MQSIGITSLFQRMPAILKPSLVALCVGRACLNPMHAHAEPLSKNIHLNQSSETAWASLFKNYFPTTDGSINFQLSATKSLLKSTFAELFLPNALAFPNHGIYCQFKINHEDKFKPPLEADAADPFYSLQPFYRVEQWGLGSWSSAALGPNLKFSTGMLNFSVHNTVCNASTGSNLRNYISIQKILFRPWVSFLSSGGHNVSFIPEVSLLPLLPETIRKFANEAIALPSGANSARCGLKVQYTTPLCSFNDIANFVLNETIARCAYRSTSGMIQYLYLSLFFQFHVTLWPSPKEKTQLPNQSTGEVEPSSPIRAPRTQVTEIVGTARLDVEANLHFSKYCSLNFLVPINLIGEDRTPRMNIALRFKKRSTKPFRAIPQLMQ